jgi:hypothetical protein
VTVKYIAPYAKAVVALFAPELMALALQAEQRHFDPVSLGWAALHGVVLAVLVWAVPNTPQK